MKLLPLFICFFLVLSYLPEGELKRSKGKGKQVKNPGSGDLKGDKRTREIITDADFNHSSSKKNKRKKDKMDKEVEDSNGGHSNSGGSKKLRGSKRQKKKEKKKHKSREKAERNSGDMHATNQRKQSKVNEGRAEERHPSQGDGVRSIVTLGLKALSYWLSGKETEGTYRSDKLRCSDKLNRQLVKFYEKEVRVPSKDVQTSRRIVDQFMKQIWTQIISNMEGLTFTRYTLVGSMSEGLAAVKIADFDFHLPLKISSGRLTAHTIPDMPGYKLISCDEPSVCDKYGEVKDGYNFLSPSRIISKLQSIVQKAVVNGKVAMIGDCHQYRPGYKGPTVSVELDCQPETYRIELVPLITTVDGQQFVAKKADLGLAKNYPLSWRQSFQEQERDLIASKSDNLSLLRLAKALFRHKEMPLNHLSSYQLKNTYCHLDRSGYVWASKPLCDQLLDFTDYLHKFAVEQNLPCCFLNSVNLFSSCTSDTIINMEGRLKRILENFDDTVKRWINVPELKDEL
ncbi:cyclic GMP-AMP synthase-like receptor [Liolophura sinensis]|uniref:cyclic GMP-AMP synthase-like receptor n=1 Tax=Liolophura sinensis TaxID=3198878 RepID=UPI003158B569